jgi:hypothetical protein
MAIDALTIAAIIVIALIGAAIVTVCTMRDNACNAGNQYLDRQHSTVLDETGTGED